jgi:hypothetical protein
MDGDYWRKYPVGRPTAPGSHNPDHGDAVLQAKTFCVSRIAALKAALADPEFQRAQVPTSFC